MRISSPSKGAVTGRDETTLSVFRLIIEPFCSPASTSSAPDQSYQDLSAYPLASSTMKLYLLTAAAFGLSVDAHAIMQVREIPA